MLYRKRPLPEREFIDKFISYLRSFGIPHKPWIPNSPIHHTISPEQANFIKQRLDPWEIKKMVFDLDNKTA